MWRAEHEHILSTNSAEQEVPVLNGCSPIKGRRSLSRPSTSDSKRQNEMTNSNHTMPGRIIDQAGRQQVEES